jgi:hypothetical protein
MRLLRAAAATIIALILVLAAQAQAPVMQVATDKDLYFPGDSIQWQCSLKGFDRSFNAATLQLWVDDVRTGERWKYRFPIINGYAEGAIRISADMPTGKYAFNFLLQPDFFNVAGRVSNARAGDTVLNYIMLFKDQETLIDRVALEQDGSFNIRGLVFQDTAMISLSRPGRNTNRPSVRIATSLDSAFLPVVPVITKLIGIMGTSPNSDTGSKSSPSNTAYHFDVSSIKARGEVLNEVVVKDRKSNKLLKEYEEAYVSPQFRTANDITLDGLNSDDMLKAGDIYQYLNMNVPGLSVMNNPETGIQEIKWRNSVVSLYVDEYRLPEGTPVTVQPGEVAVIKVYRPGSGPLTGGMSNGGAIAIYTKVGPYARFRPASDGQNRFYILGYSGRSLEWKY